MVAQFKICTNSKVVDHWNNGIITILYADLEVIATVKVMNIIKMIRKNMNQL